MLGPLSPHGQILVVGGKPGNFKPEFRNSPRLIFWHFLDHRHLGKCEIPCRVEIVVFSRFLSHRLKEKIQEMARKAGVKFLRLCQNNGEINRILRELLVAIPAEAPSPALASTSTLAPAPTPALAVPAPTTEVITPALDAGERKEEKMEERKKAGPGVVASFIKENADFSVSSSGTRNEIQRLYELALAKGLPTTLSSITSAFYKERRKMSLSPVSAVSAPKRGDSVKLLEDFLGTTELAAVALKEILEENRALK
jgi:hypothetical protein